MAELIRFPAPLLDGSRGVQVAEWIHTAQRAIEAQVDMLSSIPPGHRDVVEPAEMLKQLSSEGEGAVEVPRLWELYRKYLEWFVASPDSQKILFAGVMSFLAKTPTVSKTP